MGFYGPDFPDPMRLMVQAFVCGVAVGAAVVAVVWWLL